MVNPDDYSVGYPVESIKRYLPGGLHPVYLEDCFKDGRYKVLNKLGDGGYSTVWLVRDNLKDCNVSMKVVAARYSSNNRELDILQRIEADSQSQHEGRKYLPRLLDHFYHDGPNGRHLLLVLERLGPQSTTVIEAPANWRVDISLSRRLSRQILLAVDYLHSCGIVHGDIHANNLLFRISAEKQLCADSKEPETTKVTKKDGGPFDEGVPRYFVHPMRYTEEQCEGLRDIQLVDFSSSFFDSDPPVSVDTIKTQLSPEILFKKPMTRALDIWGLACTTYQVVTGRERFFLGLADKRVLVPMIHSHIGESSAQWLLIHVINAVRDGVWEDWPSDTAFFARGGSILEKKMSLDFSREDDDPNTMKLAEENLRVLARYLRKMFVVDPTERGTSIKLLEDEWVQKEALA